MLEADLPYSQKLLPKISEQEMERERENMNGKKLNKIKLLLGLEDNILTQSIITIDVNISALCSWLLPLASRLHPHDDLMASLCWLLCCWIPMGTNISSSSSYKLLLYNPDVCSKCPVFHTQPITGLASCVQGNLCPQC